MGRVEIRRKEEEGGGKEEGGKRAQHQRTDTRQ